MHRHTSVMHGAMCSSTHAAEKKAHTGANMRASSSKQKCLTRWSFFIQLSPCSRQVSHVIGCSVCVCVCVCACVGIPSFPGTLKSAIVVCGHRCFTQISQRRTGPKWVRTTQLWCRLRSTIDFIAMICHWRPGIDVFQSARHR